MRGMHQSFHHAGGSLHDQRSHLHQDPRAQTPLPPANEEAGEEEEMRSPLQIGGGEHRRGVHVHRGVDEWDQHISTCFIQQMISDPNCAYNRFLCMK